MSRYTVQGVLAAAVADAGTFTLSYPSGTNKGDFIGGFKNGLSIGGRDLVHFHQFLVTPGTSSITITNRSGVTWAADSPFVVGLDTPGERDLRDENGKSPIKRAYSGKLTMINLGAPIAAAANNICASQSVTINVPALLNGALLSGGRIILDVPRNVVAAWTTAAVLTVTGKDEYGNTVIESSASGTSFAGKKAFKEITSVVFGASVTGATVGTGDVLGLPCFLEAATFIIREVEDVATASAGTVVAGVTSKATALTGDVRGTYDPASACDGSKCFRLICLLGDPAYYGTTQFGS